LGNKKTESIQEWERPWSFYVDTRTDSKVTHDDYNQSLEWHDIVLQLCSMPKRI